MSERLPALTGAAIAAVVSLLFPPLLQSQQPSPDAFRKAVVAAEIRKAMNATPTAAQVAWLNRWNANDSSTVAAFLREPFDLSRQEPTLEQLEAIGALAQGVGAFSPAALAALGSGAEASGVWFPSEAALIQGLTAFLVERAKDEVIYAFVVRLQKADYSCFVEAAFERSLRALKAVEPQTFQTAMPLLRSAVEADLEELAPRLGEREFRDEACLPEQPPIEIQVGSTLYPVVRSIARGSSPAMALTELMRVDTATVLHADLVAGLNLIGAIARDYTLYGEDLRTRITGGPTLVPRYYLAFLGRGVLESLYAAPATEAQAAMDRFEGVQAQFVVFALQLDAASRALQTPRVETAVISPAVAIHTGFRLLEAAAPLIPAPRARIDSVRHALADVAHVHDLVVARDYSALVLWVVERVNLWDQARDVRLLGFAANLAAAQSAEEVEQVLHTAASPIGTYRAKRNQAGDWGPRSASIVGYVGAGGGWERGGPGSAGHVGAAVPFGVELSWGAPFGALSIFAPVVDLGTVASLRIGDDGVEAMPELGFRQVFAPGLYFMVHTGRNLPLAFGVGVQAVNDLRKVETAETRFDVTRWSLIGGIDATVLNLVW